MLTEEEKQSIINKITEKLLLTLPSIMGNLITNHISMLDMNKEFYLKHPELRDKKDIVASVVEMMEGRDPTVDYRDILNSALPEIKKRLGQIKDLNFNPVSKAERDLEDSIFDNGEL